MVVRLSAADIEPLLQGLAILGTGGGGNPDWGRQILENDVRRGRAWQVIDLDEVADDALVVCAGMMGSVKAIEAIGFEALLERWEDDFPLLTVVRAMEGLLGRRIDAVIPFEAGGLNSPVVLTLAARMGIPAVDADALGRSAPETHMTSWHGHGVAITPMPLADSEGNIVVVSQAATPTYVDEIGRMVISRGRAPGRELPPPDERPRGSRLQRAGDVQRGRGAGPRGRGGGRSGGRGDGGAGRVDSSSVVAWSACRRKSTRVST